MMRTLVGKHFRLNTCNGWAPKPPLQEGDKLLARSPVSLTNTLATTANGGQDYIYNAQTQEQWRLVVQMAGRAEKFHLWLNIWD